MDAPSLVHRWIAVVPLIATFVLVTWSVHQNLKYADIFKNLRVELPVPARLSVFVSTLLAQNVFVWLPLMLSLCWLHFGWAAKTRKRLLYFNLVLMFVLACAFLIFDGGLLLMVMKILDAFRKK
jgi:hypothetical protein